MRHAAAILLLLILPGLLLPAGMLLHVCRCAAASRPEPRSCCHEPARDATPASSCCQQQSAEAPNDDLPRAADDGCGCVWIPLPETREQPAPPDLAPAVLAAMAQPAAAVDTPPWAERQQPRRWRAADSRPPPPPSRERNLPLRL